MFLNIKTSVFVLANRHEFANSCEAVLALRIKPCCNALISNQIRKVHVPIFNVD